MSWISRSVNIVCLCVLVRTQVIPGKSRANDGDYNTVNTDGSFDFGYANKDRGSSYHLAHANSLGVVGGRFGAREPGTNEIKETIYTAGPRGFRAKGPNVHRKMDLDQRPRGPIGNKDDPNFDPNEDPSYSFKVDTRTYSKTENADSRGDVKGHYSFVDDVGERHDVSYIAGRDTGFHVSSAHPDSPNLIGNPFHRAPLVRGESKSRGRTAVQRGLDGSYRFISAGPDQRRTESSDSHGNVRGSYTFLDDKGVQRTVHYIAGPGIGYRIVKNSKDPYIPTNFPTIPSSYDPDFNAGAASDTSVYTGNDGSDDVFKRPEGTAASGHIKPSPFPSQDTDEVPAKGSSGSTGNASSGSSSSDDGSYGQRPSYSQNSGNDFNSYVDEDVSSYAEPKPTKAPGKPWRPTSRPIRPTKKPYVPLRPSQDKNINGDDYNGNTDSSKPEFAVGFNIEHTKPGGTVINNIGEEHLSVPPGVSVRAHVQSIDLYPFGSKPISPSEALESDKT